jgi:hypothetical protein
MSHRITVDKASKHKEADTVKKIPVFQAYDLQTGDINTGKMNSRTPCW